MTDDKSAGVADPAPIVVEGLVKTFRGKRGRAVQALKEISFPVRQGEVFGFLGPNGSGKSTTIKTIMGLIRPSAGKVSLCGCDVRDVAARRVVGYLPENPAFYDFLSGREYLRFVARTFAMGPAAPAQIERVLTRLDLQAAADRPLRGYSKGMVQRLGLAQALLHDPQVLILDEPMSGLDPLGRALVKELMLELKEAGKTVFFSTHVTADVERVCDRVGVIVNGVFQEERVVSELLREGVDGYFCRLTGMPAGLLARFGIGAAGPDGREIFVPRENFDSFAAALLAAGGGFELVEPRRRDIESYFLDLVAHAGGAT